MEEKIILIAQKLDLAKIAKISISLLAFESLWSQSALVRTKRKQAKLADIRICHFHNFTWVLSLSLNTFANSNYLLHS